MVKHSKKEAGFLIYVTVRIAPYPISYYYLLLINSLLSLFTIDEYDYFNTLFN